MTRPVKDMSLGEQMITALEEAIEFARDEKASRPTRVRVVTRTAPNTPLLLPPQAG